MSFKYLPCYLCPISVGDNNKQFHKNICQEIAKIGKNRIRKTNHVRKTFVKQGKIIEKHDTRCHCNVGNVRYYHRKYYHVKNYCDSFQKHNQEMLSIPGNLMSGT